MHINEILQKKEEGAKHYKEQQYRYSLDSYNQALIFLEQRRQDDRNPEEVDEDDGYSGRDLELLELEIKKGIAACFQPFFSAVHENNRVEIERFIKKEKFSIDRKDETGGTALLYAVLDGHIELVEFLLAEGANPEEQDNEGYSILWHINECDVNEEIKLYLVVALAKRKQLIDNKNYTKEEFIWLLHNQLINEISPLLESVKFPLYRPIWSGTNHSDKCRNIQDYIECLNPDFFSQKLLKAVIDNSSKKLLEALACGTFINMRFYDYGTVLHDAAAWGHCEIIHKLNEYGADFKAKNEDGWTAMHYALEDSKNTKKEVVELLIKIEPNLAIEPNNYGQTPLHFVAESENIDLAKLLTASINAQDNDGLTPLHNAAPYCPTMEHFLIESGAVQTIRNNEGRTPAEYRNEILKQMRLSSVIYQTKEYRHNTSLLLSCLLFQRQYPLDTPPISSRHNILTNPEALTLKEIARRVVLYTGKGKRNIQFIAVGIREDGNHVITTNADTPSVYRLEDMISEGQFEKAKNKKKEKFKALTSNKPIHAETMLAALKNQLNIKKIFVVQANGEKTRNCVFCSNYLAVRGFDTSAHPDHIKNYSFPSQKDIKLASQWFFWLSTNFSNKRYQLSDDIVSAPLLEIEDKIDFKQLSYLCPPNTPEVCSPFELMSSYITRREKNEVGTGYDINICKTVDESVHKNVTQTYVDALRLARPEKSEISVVSGNMKRGDQNPKNYQLTLFDDGRLKRSSDARSILPVSPKSPRSKLLAEKINFWLDKGINPKVTVNENIIIATREDVESALNNSFEKIRLI